MFELFIRSQISTRIRPIITTPVSHKTRWHLNWAFFFGQTIRGCYY